MVHAPVILPVNGNLDGMDVAAYPIVRFPGGGFAGRLNDASARNPAHKETGNPDRPDYAGLGLDLEPNLLSKPVRRSLGDMLGVDREARAVLDLNVLTRQENTVLTFQVVLVVDTGRADDVLVLRLVQFVPDLHDLLIGHKIAWDGR